MTPERAAYHRVMILAGFCEEYERELDETLEALDPIPEPELSLACCMSDPKQTASVLYQFVQEHPADEQQVFELLLSEVRRRYVEDRMTAVDTCKLLSSFQEFLRQMDGFGLLWLDLYYYLYEYELLDEGMISQEVFEACFESVFLRGERVDVWALQGAYNQKK